MRDDLVAMQVEVDPMLGASAFRAAEQLTIEAASGIEVVDWERDVEGGRVHRTSLACSCVIGNRFCCPTGAHFGIGTA
jgi:hypothetical protein